MQRGRLFELGTPGAVPEELEGSTMQENLTAEFEKYFRTDYKSLIWFAQRVGASLPEAEESAQEAMRTLWERWEQVENPAAYTRQAVRRALYRVHDKAKRSREAEVRHASSQVRTTLPTAFDADVQRVLGLLRELPAAQREVFALHMDGWSTDEIAEITGQKAGTVRSNLRHARQKLTRLI